MVVFHNFQNDCFVFLCIFFQWNQNCIFVSVYFYHINRSLGFKAEEVQQFIADLTAERPIEVIWVDERLTTVSAERALLEADVSRAKRKKVVDKMAAVIILQSYLVPAQ